MKVLAYVRVSTKEQASHGMSLEAHPMTNGFALC